jgi:hypothetical protein
MANFRKPAPGDLGNNSGILSGADEAYKAGQGPAKRPPVHPAKKPAFGGTKGHAHGHAAMKGLIAAANKFKK